MSASGEEHLLTLFSDVHYYFAEPSPRPVHHRFDKESYVYLYRDPAQKRGRLEIANHAGTPEQDAFTGYLDNVRISQSQRHPTLVTITVDAFGAPPTQQSDHHWRLPSTDPRDEGKYLFRLHTLDIYFWTVDDTRFFLQNAQQTLQARQLNIENITSLAPNPNIMSPVVQNLENIAITDPAYRREQGATSRSGSTAAQAGSTEHGSTASPPPPAQQQSFTPLAYNPSAPPPPEEIKHREKTPPPPDAAVVGTGLAAAAYNDHVYAQQRQEHSSHLLPPTTMPPPSYSLSDVSPARTSSAQNRYIPQGIDPATYARTQSAQQPLDSPTEEILGANYHTGSRHSVGHLQPQYMDYLSSRPAGSPPSQTSPVAQHHSQHHSHHNQQHQQHQSLGDYELHSQVYVPAEGEAAGFGGKSSKHGRASMASQGSQGSASSHGQGSFGQGRLEAGASRVERGVNRWLKKVEERIG